MSIDPLRLARTGEANRHGVRMFTAGAPVRLGSRVGPGLMLWAFP